MGFNKLKKSAHKKKIVFFSCYDSPLGGGSPRTFLYSRELVKLGYDVWVVTSSYNHWMDKSLKKQNKLVSKKNIEGVNYIFLFGLNYGENNNLILRSIHMIQYSFLAFFFILFRIKKIDVILGTTTPNFSGLMALCLSSLKESKFFLEIRDVWPESLIDSGSLKKNSMVAIIMRMIEKFLVRNSTEIISCLPNTLEHIIKSGGPNKMTYIPNPYDSDLIFNKYCGGNRGELRITYVGGNAKAMRVNTLIEAFLMLDLPRISLQIVGPKKFVKNYFKNLKKPLPKNMKVYDFVQRSKIPEFINNSDVLVHPSNNTDQLKFGLNSNKILEYLSSGRLTILAAKTANDPVSMSKSGFLIEPENEYEMARVFKKIYYMDPKEREKIGVRGIKFVKSRFNSKNLVLEFKKLIDS